MVRALRILHVIGSLDGGGAERVLLTVLHGLTDCEQMLALAGDGALLPMVPPSVPVRAARTESELAELIAMFKPDLVQTWLDGSLLMAVSPVAHFGIPLVHRMYNVPRMQKVFEPGGPGHHQMMARALAVATRIVALTPTVADEASEFYGIERPRVVFNGLPLAGRRGSSSAPIEKPPGRFIILNAARLAPQKGQAFLIEAFARMAGRHAHAELWFAGIGQSEQELRAMVAGKRLAGRVHFLGFHEDVSALHAVADLFVFPSVFEGFGNALAEAMLAGLPVVASDLAVIRRDVLDGHPAAWLVPPGDIAGLAAALDQLIADEPRRLALGRAARQVATRFRVDHMLNEYRQLYRELVPGLLAA